MRPFEPTAGRDWRKVRHLDLSCLWLQAAVRGEQVNLKKEKSESNIADFGTKAFDMGTIDRIMKKLGWVRFDW